MLTDSTANLSLCKRFHTDPSRILVGCTQDDTLAMGGRDGLEGQKQIPAYRQAGLARAEGARIRHVNAHTRAKASGLAFAAANAET